MRIMLFAAVMLAVLPSCLAQKKWQAVSSQVTFKIKNAGINVSGSFAGLSTTLVFSPDKLSTSSLKGYVEAATINTGIKKRDKDLKEEKYFQVEKYKLIEVSSVKLYKKGDQYAGLFNVVMKGVTRQVEIPFQFIVNGDEVAFKGSFSVNRRDFAVGGKTLTMSDNATVTIDIKAKS